MVEPTAETLLGVDQVGLVKGMRDQVDLCQYAMDEISQQRDEELEAADREHQLDIYNLKVMIQKRMAQKSHVEELQKPLGALWESELPEWKQAWTLSHEEISHIKKELETLENQIARCEENHSRRKDAADKLLKQRVKHYKRVIYHVRAEAEKCCIPLDLPK